MIYVMSDIHGQKRRFDSVMKQINLQPEDTLYVLGDVIDRNPDGIKILRQIMAMSNAKMLLGNHELMMMNALYYPPPEDCLLYTSCVQKTIMFSPKTIMIWAFARFSILLML